MAPYRPSMTSAQEAASRRSTQSARMQTNDSVKDILPLASNVNQVVRQCSSPAVTHQDTRASLGTTRAEEQRHVTPRRNNVARMQSTGARDALTHCPTRPSASELGRRASPINLRMRSCSPDRVQNAQFYNGTSKWVGGPSSPRAAQDHLWRELFHEEVDEQPSACVRGQGISICQRGRSSAGVPWRHLPVYSQKGALASTGDQLSRDQPRRQVTAREGDDQRPAPMSSDGVRDRLHLTGSDAQASPQRGAHQHWSFKPQKRAVQQQGPTKDSCPYFRIDSAPQARAVREAGLGRRIAMSPPATVERGSLIPTSASPPPAPAHRNPAMRRTWLHDRKMADIYDEVLAVCQANAARRRKSIPRMRVQHSHADVASTKAQCGRTEVESTQAASDDCPCSPGMPSDVASVASESSVSTAREVQRVTIEEAAG